MEEHHTDGRTKPWAHDRTVALGSWHHRGVPHSGWLHSSMRIEFGPSLAEGSKPFAAKFGTGAELVAMQDAILRGEDWEDVAA